MTALLYRPDIDAARDRMTAWWNDGDIGRPVLLLTCSVLVLLLGLNVSAMGLVAIPRSSLYLVAEMFALILVLNVAYVLVFIFLERKSLLWRRVSHQLVTNESSN